MWNNAKLHHTNKAMDSWPMRLKLFLAFVLIVIITVTCVVWIARINAADVVRTYMFRGGMVGEEGLVVSLEQFYKVNRTWSGVEVIFDRSLSGKGLHSGQGMGQGMGGMMSQRFALADENGTLLVDTAGEILGQLQQDELSEAIQLVVEGKTVGYLLVEGRMNFTSADETRLVTQVNQAALTAGLIGGGISLVLAMILAYGLVRPVKDLTKAAHKLAQGKLDQRVAVRGSDEMAVLGNTFNQMADSLQQAETRRRAMTADIAHELRNPLAVQRANLEALQDGVYSLNADTLQPLLEQNYLLTRLVEDLRTLALADAGELELVKTSVDLNDIVLRVSNQFMPQARNEDIDIQISTENALAMQKVVLVDQNRLEQILGNLLSNALRYTSQGGKIEINTQFANDSARISVHDGGPGIPEAALPFIFDRFYRADRSRSRQDGGTGLGLAIARQLAKAHGGLLEATNHPGGGAIFTLTLPR